MRKKKTISPLFLSRKTKPDKLHFMSETHNQERNEEKMALSPKTPEKTYSFRGLKNLPKDVYDVLVAQEKERDEALAKVKAATGSNEPSPDKAKENAPLYIDNIATFKAARKIKVIFEESVRKFYKELLPENSEAIDEAILKCDKTKKAVEVRTGEDNDVLICRVRWNKKAIPVYRFSTIANLLQGIIQDVPEDETSEDEADKE